MISRNKTRNRDSLLKQIDRTDPDCRKKNIELLIEMGRNIDVNDFNSLYGWINSTFTQLESFSSEHLTFRLHCLHTGLAMLSVALEKESWINDKICVSKHMPYSPEQ
jgi:hypothetical protein